MKWLIFGSKGWIASYVTRYLTKAGESVIEHTSHLNMNDDVSSIIDSYSPDRIVCCIGKTYGPGFSSIDYLEQKGKLIENLESNLYLPIKIASSTTIPILYFGTGCIYEFDEEHTPENQVGFTEKDPPNFTGSSYSTVKLTTDQLMKQFKHVINARIRMPISLNEHDRDFVTKIMRYPRVINILNSMTVLDDVIPRLLAITYEGTFFGTINAVNRGCTDHATILEMFERPRSSYSIQSLEQQDKQLLSRRSNNILDSSLFDKLCSQLQDLTLKKFQINNTLPDLKDSLQEIADHRSSNKRNLLVTGGYGFIASNFVNYWTNKYPGDRIVLVDRIDTCSNIKNIKRTQNIHEYALDINQTQTILGILKSYQITHIVHFAAETHVDNSFGNALSFTKSNVLGTHSLLEASKTYGKLKCFLHMSTDEVYGEVHEGAADETSLLFPTNPYAATKAAAEYIVHSYGKSFRLPYMIMRANNIYGIHQYPEKVIPAFTTALLNNQRLKIQGDGSARRMFLHVNDLVSAVETIFFKGTLGETYNIGTTEEYTVLELAKLMIQKIKQDTDYEKYIDYIPDRLFNDCRYSINSEKIEKLGWCKKHTLELSLDDIIEWYKNHIDYWN
jgi:UDP-glucose 4,6-dehydratase